MSVFVGRIAADPGERRSAERVDIGRPCIVRLADGTAIQARIEDLTREGCRIDTPVPLSARQSISIGIPGVGTVAAQVMWFGDRGYGCAFDRPLPPGSVTAAIDDNVVPLIVAQHPPVETLPHGKWSPRARIALVGGVTLLFWGGLAALVFAG